MPSGISGSVGYHSYFLTFIYRIPIDFKIAVHICDMT